MSDFWAQRLGVQQAPAPGSTQVQPAAPTAPWWLPKAPPAPVQQQQPHTSQATTVVSQGTPLQTQPVQQQAMVAEDGKYHLGDLLQQDGYTTDKAQSMKDSEFCPDCGSTNYMATKGHPNAMKKCFDCGYNPRFTQSMAGMSGTGQNIPVKTARVQQMNTNTFNPGHIIAKI